MADALVEKILSGEIKAKGKFGVGLKDDDNGFLSLKFNVAKRNVENYYLVLTNSRDAEDKIILTGVQREKDVLFDLAACSAITKRIDELWLCYILFENEGAVTYKRLTNGKIDNALDEIADDNDINEGQIVLRNINEYVKSIYTFENNGLKYEFYLNKNKKRNTLSISSINNKFVPILKERGVLQKVSSDKKKFEYIFSIVIAVYNVENYLDETVMAIINQDIEFEKHVQLILVDDGSQDGSPAICDKYAAMYPDNVIVIHKENGGVASARNAGKKIATGKYVNFCDSDDKFSENVLSSIQNFFDSHYYETDIVTMPIYFFDAEEGEHWQNYKFKNGARVIDLWKDYNTTLMFVTSSFFKNELVQKFEFDSTLPCGEDAKFISQILLECMTLGVVTDGCFFYRRRGEGGSLINTSRTKKSFYFEYFDNFVFYLFEYSRKKFGFIPYFVQNMVMSDLQWRFRMIDFSDAGLSESEIKRYKGNLTKAFSSIDDNIIERQLKLTIDHKLQLYKFKYGQDCIDIRRRLGDINLMLGNKYIASISNMLTQISSVEIENDIISIEGFAVVMGIQENADVKVYIRCIGDYYECDNIVRLYENKNCFGVYKHEYGFSCKLPVKKDYIEKRIRVCISIDGEIIDRTFYRYGKFSAINLLANQYCFYEPYIIMAKKDCMLIYTSDREDIQETLFVKRVEDRNNLLEECKFTDEEKSKYYDLIYEEKYLYSLYKNINFIEDSFVPATNSMLTEEKFKKIADLRRFAKLHKKTKPIWIISDRLMFADDNGEAFFKYLMSKTDLPVDVYFTIKKESKDYDRMCEIGPVLDYGSDEHLRMHLIADYVISSQGEDSVFTPFAADSEYYGDRKYFADLLGSQKFIFLQHGVIMNDLSAWLTRYNKNIKGFVTSAYREQRSIIEYPYGYKENEVWLTGLPRFDYMYDDLKNQIVLCPTWRAYLQDMTEEKFADTKYFKSFKELIEDKNLKKALKKTGNRLVLKLHPRMRDYIELFENLEDITILSEDISYRQIFAESRLMITDYSSTSMDFAYINKPVVYFQFDKDEVFSGAQMYTEGYFDYERDGFGPVTDNVKDTVKAIVKILKNDCKIDSIYEQRRNGFFLDRDGKNCERVYNRILKLSSDFS